MLRLLTTGYGTFLPCRAPTNVRSQEENGLNADICGFGLSARTNLISYIDASAWWVGGATAAWPLAAHAIAGTIAEPPVRIAEFERPNDLPGLAASDR